MFTTVMKDSVGSGSSYGSSGFSSGSVSSEPFNDLNPGIIIALVVVAFLITVIVFVLLVKRKKPIKGRFLHWLREFLNFRSLLIAGLIKFAYLFLTISLTITGIVLMCLGRDDTVLPMILSGLAVIILGNIVLRLMMEGMMIMIGMWENTSDMRAVMVKNEEEAKLEVEVPASQEPVAKEEIVGQAEPTKPVTPSQQQ
ncbi:DUF4282 domain-containing protein [Candidatus Saccharibacteria bacterium]|nr:DUF4282 domain-containing protein [Candidatus Saccharibacteria bacterium]